MICLFWSCKFFRPISQTQYGLTKAAFARTCAKRGLLSPKNVRKESPGAGPPESKNVYTEQMDAEGLGRRLLLTPSSDPRRAPEKQTVGTVTASQKMLSLQAFSLPVLQRGAVWAEERLLGAVCSPERPRPFTYHRECTPESRKSPKSLRSDFRTLFGLVLRVSETICS